MKINARDPGKIKTQIEEKIFLRLAPWVGDNQQEIVLRSYFPSPINVVQRGFDQRPSALRRLQSSDTTIEDCAKDVTSSKPAAVDELKKAEFFFGVAEFSQVTWRSWFFGRV